MSHPIVQIAGWALVHAVWQGVVIAGVLSLALQLLPARAARVRYGLACLALVLMAVLPVASAWRSPVEAGVAVAQVTARAAVLPVVTSPSTDVGPGRAPHPLERVQHQLTAASQVIDENAHWLVFAWALGVVLASSRVVRGWRQVVRLTKSGSQARADWQAAVERLRIALGIQRPVRLLASAHVDVPSTVGWLRPIVLVPVSALAGLSTQHLELILAHELAHIRRHDYLVNLLQTALETLLFFHPAVWWIGGIIRAERENCCDDIAVTGANALVYARALTRLEALRSMPSPALSALGGSLPQRVRRLVAPAGRCVTQWSPGASALTLAASLFFSVPLVTLALPVAAEKLVRGEDRVVAPAPHPLPTAAAAATRTAAVPAAPQLAAPSAGRAGPTSSAAGARSASGSPTAVRAIAATPAAAPSPSPPDSAARAPSVSPSAGVATPAAAPSPSTRGGSGHVAPPTPSASAAPAVATAPAAALPANAQDSAAVAPSASPSPSAVRAVVASPAPSPSAFARVVRGDTSSQSRVAPPASRATTGAAVAPVLAAPPGATHSDSAERPIAVVAAAPADDVSDEDDDEDYRRKRKARDEVDAHDSRTVVGRDTLSVDQLISLRTAGVDAEMIRSVQQLGFQPTVQSLVGFGHAGITPEYVREMRERFGSKLDEEQLIGMKHLGVTPDYVRALEQLGFSRLAPDQVMGARAVGVTESYARSLRSSGLDIRSLEELTGLRAVGVDGAYVEELQSMRLGRLTLDDVQSLRALGVTASWARALADEGIHADSVDQLQTLRAHGVDAKFVKGMKAAGIPNLTTDKVIDLKVGGITPEYLQSLRGE